VGLKNDELLARSILTSILRHF